MRKKIEIVECDICENRSDSGEVAQLIIEPISLQLIFTSEQTEGRNITPYLTTENLDVCTYCKERILSGNYVYGCGAQGHNSYGFRTKNDV